MTVVTGTVNVLVMVVRLVVAGIVTVVPATVVVIVVPVLTVVFGIVSVEVTPIPVEVVIVKPVDTPVEVCVRVWAGDVTVVPDPIDVNV